MLGRRRTGNNMPAVVDTYGERAAAAESVYNADLVPPATSWATSRSALSARYAMPTIGPKVRAFFKDNHWRLDGLKWNWSWGGIDMGRQITSLPGATGGNGLAPFVRSTDFQTTLVQLHNWQTNDKWYICWNGTGSGMFQGSKEVRYQYPSFRVAQIDTSVTGGPGKPSMRMNRVPRYTSVQTIQKYTTTPKRYNTKGSQ
jgi:hypothetical protein